MKSLHQTVPLALAFAVTFGVATAAAPSWAQTGVERLHEAAILGIDGKRTIDDAANQAVAAKTADATQRDGGPIPVATDGGPVGVPAPVFADGGPVAAKPATTDAGPPPEVVDEEAEALAQLIRDQEADRERAEAAAKAAEQAQQEALQNAREAKSALLEKILNKIAAAQGAKVALAEADTTMRNAVQASLEAASKELEDAKLSLRAATSAAEGQGDALLDAAIAQQRVALNETREAMTTRSKAWPTGVSDALDDVPGSDQVDLSRQLADEDRKQVNQRLAELATTIDEVQRAEASLSRNRAEVWYEVADARLSVASTLNATRLKLISKASKTRASDLRGLTVAGRDNVVVALEYLGTLLSFHVQRRIHDVKILPARLADPLYSGSLIWVLVKLLLTIAFGVFLFRRGPTIYERLRTGLLTWMTNRARVKLVESVLAIAEDTAPQATLLAFAIWTVDVLKRTGPEPELSTIFGILIWVLSFQLASKLTHRLVLRLARRRHAITVPQKLKIIKTVRTMMRFGFVAAFILLTTASLVGEGILFAFIRGAVALGGAVIFLVLVRRWREDIVETYLAGWEDSSLARVIQKHQDRWFSLPLAVLALVSVAARALMLLVRDFVLGFEQSRKALAYLFQIRVERKTKEQGRRQVDTASLPEVVRTTFADVPCSDRRFLIDRFADQAPFVERFARGDKISLLVTAPAGGGVTTWLNVLLPKIKSSVEVVPFAIEGRLTTKEDVFRAFNLALGLEPGQITNPHQVRVAIADRSVVFVLDGLERLFLRGLDGYQALTALADVMVETEFFASYIVCGRLSAVRFLDKTRSLSTSFDARVELAAWSESEIRDLIQRRQRTTKLPLSFEDLLVKELDAAVDSAHVVETENGYLRLLWSYAEGNPRTVLYFWLRSLVADGDEAGLKVQLHDAPSVDDLEVIPAQERFFLQALLLHRALTPAQMARTCNLPLGRARAHVARLTELGLYALDDKGVVTVRTHFWQSAARYLRRKNMLSG